MRVGQPGVQRPHRHLHREGHEKRDEQQKLRRFSERHLMEVSNREAATGHRVQINQRDQHQQRAEQRVQEKLDRCVEPIRAAPDADDQIHRDQHRLEEHVEQHAVGSGKCPVDQTGHDQEGREILRRLFLDHHPACDDGEDGGEAVEQHKPHRNAVNAQVVIDLVALNPRHVFNELQRSSCGVKTGVQRNGDDEACDCGNERNPARGRGGLVARGGQGGETA